MELLPDIVRAKKFGDDDLEWAGDLWMGRRNPGVPLYVRVHAVPA
jgi:hypothetical protein